MELRKNFSLIIISAFLLVLILQCFPTCLAARYLADGPQPDDNGQSLSGVNGSQARQAGSATGESPPANGVVQRPPTPPFYRSTSSTQRNSSKTVTTSHNGVKNSTTTTSHDEQKKMDWNGKKSETNSSGVNVTTNGNGSGGAQVSSPTPNVVYEPPAPFNFPPFPPFP